MTRAHARTSPVDAVQTGKKTFRFYAYTGLRESFVETIIEIRVVGEDNLHGCLIRAVTNLE